MVYYIKQGQISIFRNIKLTGNECEISNTTLSIKKIEKIVKKIRKNNIKQVVLSKKIKENSIFVEKLNNYDITILDGKWLMQYLVIDIIKKLEEKGKIQNFDEISLLVNDLTNEVKQNIRKFADIYKKIRIVTNHLEKFRELEKELYEGKGMSIVITNNKRKALSKSTLIVNFDFVEETINEFNINESALIINLNEKIKINKKRFSGVIITDYEVEIANLAIEYQTEFLDCNDIFQREKDFSLKEILEEKIYSNSDKITNFNMFEKVENVIKTYNVKVKQLYGINGILT